MNKGLFPNFFLTSEAPHRKEHRRRLVNEDETLIAAKITFTLFPITQNTD